MCLDPTGVKVDYPAAVATSSQIYRFTVELSDVDRSMFETLDLRMARHPSETDRFMVARLLAYSLNYQPGIGFSAGICVGDEPAVQVQDLTGKTTHWIEVGLPSLKKLQRGLNHSPHVTLYVHRNPAQLLRDLEQVKDRRTLDSIDMNRIPDDLLDALSAALHRTNTWTITISDGALYIDTGETTLTSDLSQWQMTW